MGGPFPQKPTRKNFILVLPFRCAQKLCQRHDVNIFCLVEAFINQLKSLLLTLYRLRWLQNRESQYCKVPEEY